MEVTLAVYAKNGGEPYARVAVAYDLLRKAGDKVSESDMSIGSDTVDVYTFVCLKKVNLGNKI